MISLGHELDDSDRLRVPELEVDIELTDDMLLDPWFQRSEAEIALLDDDPNAHVCEILLAPRPEALDYVV